GAGPADPALDGAYGAIADLGGLLVGEPRRADQDYRLALVFGKLLQRRLEVLEVELSVLARVNGEPRGHQPLRILNLAAPLAHLRIEFVAQDGEQPRLEVGARLEALMLVPGLDQRLLHQVVRLVGVLGQRHRKGPQTGNRAEK